MIDTLFRSPLVLGVEGSDNVHLFVGMHYCLGFLWTCWRTYVGHIFHVHPCTGLTFFSGETVCFTNHWIYVWRMKYFALNTTI